MFTGLIRDVGVVRSWQKRADSALFSIETKLNPKDLEIGASVACNGACLTVVQHSSTEHDSFQLFFVEAGPQTLALTRFGFPEFAGVGELVNLEPALRMGDALGGHAVSGHVDTLGVVLANEATGDGFWRLRISYPSELSNYVVKKGSIAVAGVSLTIADCAIESQSSWVEIMLIPHTLMQTNLKNLQVGSRVEIEFDSQAKLVANLLKVMIPEHLKTTFKKN
ncbi:riboflavin synthase [bacterium]|nr:riboflavin synthase [bacterium]